VTPVTVPHARARAATVVAVGHGERLEEAARILTSIDQSGSLRCVLIPTDASPLAVETSEDLAVVRGVPPAYLNNAIAALRLSSLPTVVWWRGGPPERLEGAASLADRVILDAEEVEPLWARAMPLFTRTAFTDLRWARLTRWRRVLAHLFEVPSVRAAAFARLSVSGSDAAQCALFGGWLDGALGWAGRVPVERAIATDGAGLSAVALHGRDGDVAVKLLAGGACLAGEARADGTVVASRVVPAGDQHVAALLSEELGVRSRDRAFEQALSRVSQLTFGDA
jgi:glucose-6-phosphate dehydrogenase assembly protein OpcA